MCIDANAIIKIFLTVCQFLNLVHPSSPDCGNVARFQAHGEIINAIDGVGGLGLGEGAPELVTGSRDGVVKVWDPRQTAPVASVEPAEGEEKVRRKNL